MPSKPAPEMQDRGRLAYAGCGSTLLGVLIVYLLLFVTR